MLDRADVGPVVAPAAHTHGESEIGSHADSHAEGGSDPVSPESIGALMDEGVSLKEGESLDDLVEGGTYVRSSPANNTVALGYPVDGWAGFIQVLPSTNPNYVLQRAYSLLTSGDYSYANKSYFRTKYGDTWGEWKRLVTDDDPRLLDTGWREMPADEWISETAFPVMAKRRLRRVGNTVWVGLEFEYEPDKFSYRPSATPSGFRPDLSAFSAPMAGYSGEPIQIGVFGLNSSGTTFMRTRPGISPGTAGYFTTSWTTSDRWPTTLPGTPA